MSISRTLITRYSQIFFIGFSATVAITLMLFGCASTSEPETSSTDTSNSSVSNTKSSDESMGDNRCDGPPKILFKNPEVVRVECDQGIWQGTVRYENALFQINTDLSEDLVVTHRRLIDPEYYYPHRNTTLEKQIVEVFSDFKEYEFDGDGVVKTGFASVFEVARFTGEGTSCVGFSKHNKQAFTLGYVCRDGDTTYESEEIKDMLSKLKFK